MFSTRDAILATLCYSDLFNYPLTGAELKYWLVKKAVGSTTDLLKYLPGQVDTSSGIRGEKYYFLKSGQKLIARRKQRLIWSEQKLRIARRVGRWLQLVPTLMLAGITGGLAINNTEKKDDIDFLLITSPGTLWLSRLIAVGVLELLGKRRRPQDTKYQDKICLNMLMTTAYLEVPTGERDLFTAHELLQMHVLWERRGTYQKFLRANQWVKEFLPNAWWQKTQEFRTKNPRLPKSRGKIASYILRLLEEPSKRLQLRYMRSRRTTEVISDYLLRFHPLDIRAWIKVELARSLSRYKIPLDKVFW